MPDKPAGPENNRAQARAEAHAQESAQTLRLDKWLWFARFCKTRTLAANLCRSGRVRINKTPTEKPNHQIRPGDILTFPQAAWVRVVKVVAGGPVFISVDVDVLDPAFAPGTGTPEPGGMTTVDLLRACRELAARIDVIGADVVEVIPTGIGSADVTATAADRIVREILTGLALRRR